MRLITYLDMQLSEKPRSVKLGALVGGLVVDMEAAQAWAQAEKGLADQPVPHGLADALADWEEAGPYLAEIVAALEGENPMALRSPERDPVGMAPGNTRIMAPLPRPLSFRDFYAFEEHVSNGMALRGRKVREQWYEMPVFYFSNAHSFYGHGERVPRPSYTERLDYELEIACVLGKGGINISADEAPDYIAGYTILNDWSARDIQLQEMAVGLGPAKGKDFANSLGPALVTPDELADKQVGEGAELRYDLEMVARINGEERSRGNFGDIYWTFSQMIEHAARDVYLYPGEVLGSGTVGTGCLLEQGAEESGDWLKPGDIVELEIEGLGVLRNQVTDPLG